MPHPLLLEVNALLLSRRQPDGTNLASVSHDSWSRIAGGFDYLWLMGVWQRSDAGRRQALAVADHRAAYDAALGTWATADVVGSPYAIAAYDPDPRIGSAEDLVSIRQILGELGVRLVLDFVPNHLALDHPWTLAHPERFVRGRETDLHERPGEFFSPSPGIVLAHGRDPYFPPWTDTAQLDLSSAATREALIDELLRVAELSDGVRCDMAMLALSDVIARVWGCDPPPREFWSEAIGRVRERRPDFLFLAESYWGLEGRLLELGFDYAYDKRLYDRLLHEPAAAVRSCLAGGDWLGERGAHFVENHDEPRAAAAFGPERARAAAVVMATLPGLRFIHDGQAEGRRIRLPVQLGREPREAPDPAIRELHDRLLRFAGLPALRSGTWALLAVDPLHEGDDAAGGLLAWAWTTDDALALVVVNDSPFPARGRVRVPLPPSAPPFLELVDALDDALYLRGSAEMREPGLTVLLGSWRSHCLLAALEAKDI